MSILLYQTELLRVAMIILHCPDKVRSLDPFQGSEDMYERRLKSLAVAMRLLLELLGGSNVLVEFIDSRGQAAA